MLELRAVAAGNESRAELRALAAEFPGALRELDRMPTDEIARRHAACARAGDGDAGEDWIAWMGRYHELMRAALALRRGEPVAADVMLPPERAQSFARPPGGRLNAVVFAILADELGLPARAIADALFPARGKPR
jgi:hypothetical protein